MAGTTGYWEAECVSTLPAVVRCWNSDFELAKEEVLTEMGALVLLEV